MKEHRELVDNLSCVFFFFMCEKQVIFLFSRRQKSFTCLNSFGRKEKKISVKTIFIFQDIFFSPQCVKPNIHQFSSHEHRRKLNVDQTDHQNLYFPPSLVPQGFRTNRKKLEYL